MQTLRGQDGCDWDKQQTLQTLKKYLLEETYELIDVIDTIEKKPSAEAIEHHREELGDMLLQLVFQSQIQTELGHFSFDDVAQSIVEKMIRRHPHIFGAEKKDPEATGNPFWHTIKEQENQRKGHGIFASVSKSQPALSRAGKLGEKAARLGFDWESADDAFLKIHEELNELQEAMKNNNVNHASEELGDLLHAITQVARHLNIDPELALHASNEKFLQRFAKMAERAGGENALKGKSIEEMTTIWNQIKRL